MRIPEFSKKLVNRFLIIFLVHTVLSIAAMVFTALPDGIVGVYTAAVPVYMTVFGGYYGKAAVENAKKISQALKEETTIESNG